MSKKNIKTYQDIDKEIEKLQVEKNLLLEKQLSSKESEDIIKAHSYLEKNNQKKKGDGVKAYMFSPEREFYSGLGYKSSLKSVTYDLLRGMGDVPIIKSAITTRTDQIRKFINFQVESDREGWTIAKKLGKFEKAEGNYELTDDDKKNIEKIVSFIENGGYYNKWSLNDDFEVSVTKIIKDSLELDQPALEIERVNRGDLYGFTAIDGGTIRNLETIDPREVKNTKYEEINGYYPRYCQVYNQRILTHWETKEPIVYYPWELAVPIRNYSSDIKRNGYGKSELEILVEVVTWLLWGMQYNGNFFKQGSHPKGFITLQDAGDQDTLNEFRSAWRNMMSGVHNAHKIPVFEGKDIQWMDMHHSNRDMEFGNWNEFLILIVCSVYRIDPSELGFNFKQQTQLFGQQGQKERLDHSKDKGLKPLLRMLEKMFNKYIVSEIDDRYEFKFTGIDIEDEEQLLKNDATKIDKGMVSMEDMFEKHSGRKFDPKKDTVLNPVYWQAQQAQQFGGQESNEAVDEMTGEPDEGVQNPFDEYEKAWKDNPIAEEANKRIEEMFNK
jgi:hypothetical protein